MLLAQEVLQHLFGVPSSCLAQMRRVVLGFLSSLQEKCKEDFFAFLDIWQGLAEMKKEKNSLIVCLFNLQPVINLLQSQGSVNT